jgi:hypothetical protein
MVEASICMQRTVFNFFFGGAGSSVVAMGTGGVS